VRTRTLTKHGPHTGFSQQKHGPHAGILQQRVTSPTKSRREGGRCRATRTIRVPDCQVPDCQVPDCQVPDCQVPDCQVPDCIVRYLIVRYLTKTGIQIVRTGGAGRLQQSGTLAPVVPRRAPVVPRRAPVAHRCIFGAVPASGTLITLLAHWDTSTIGPTLRYDPRIGICVVAA
jgi:hypothetical protein